LTLTKYKKTQDSIFSKISNGYVEIKLEVSFQTVQGTITEYKKVDGGFMDIFSLTPKQFFYEKISAYNNRMLIRDLYDIYFLSHLFDLDKNDKKHLKTKRSKKFESDYFIRNYTLIR